MLGKPNVEVARLIKHATYFEDLLDGKDVIHKDDPKNFTTDEITFVTEDGKHVDTVMAVIRDAMRDKEVFQQNLCNRIADKNEKIRGYTTSLSFHSLLIADRSSYLNSIKKNQIHSALYTDEVISLLKKSEFSEIYLLREYQDGYCYFPLKGWLFLSHLHFFMEILRNQPGIEKYTHLAYHSLFAEFLECEGFRDVKIVMNEREPEVVYGSFGILIKDDENTIIRDYQRHRSPSSLASAPGQSGLLTEEFKAIREQVRRTFSIETEFCFNIKDNPRTST